MYSGKLLHLKIVTQKLHLFHIIKSAYLDVAFIWGSDLWLLMAKSPILSSHCRLSTGGGCSKCNIKHVFGPEHQSRTGASANWCCSSTGSALVLHWMELAWGMGAWGSWERVGSWCGGEGSGLGGGHDQWSSFPPESEYHVRLHNATWKFFTLCHLYTCHRIK